MSSKAEKGGGTFEGIKMLLCENPLPPIAEAIAAAQEAVPHSNYYTEPSPRLSASFSANS